MHVLVLVPFRYARGILKFSDDDPFRGIPGKPKARDQSNYIRMIDDVN